MVARRPRERCGVSDQRLAAMSDASTVVSVRADLSSEVYSAEHFLRSARHLCELREFARAEICARSAIKTSPDSATAYLILGHARRMQSDPLAAIDAYRKAMQLNPKMTAARRHLAKLLARLGRRDESLVLCHAELTTGREGLRWLWRAASEAMNSRNLSFAGEMAWILACLRLGSTWQTCGWDNLYPFPVQEPKRHLTMPKLAHDIDQFAYLQERRVFGEELTPVIQAYQRVMDLLVVAQHCSAQPERAELQPIEHVYNRIIHVRPTPHIARALSGAWDPRVIENRYLTLERGLVVIDDFLSPEAIEEVRKFCLESTVWSANCYAHGRLGAFFHDGFNCPLLLQIAGELRAAMPLVIGQNHPLKQLYAFKTADSLPPNSTTHADFASVNVNFWITPEDANLDPSTGGMVVHNVDAPCLWDFMRSSDRSCVAPHFRVRRKGDTLTIPYRRNRAVIFHSDLFHGPAEVRFRRGYENRRIEIILLYGTCEQTSERPPSPDWMTEHSTGAWRSAALSPMHKR